MKFEVRGHRLLIKPLEIKDEEVSTGGIVIPKKSEDLKRERKGSEQGEVLQVGSTCWKGGMFSSSDESWEPWCKVGDKIFFAKYSGKFVVDTDTQEEFLVINDEDVQCVIKG
jgi:co-chaperonin GroES (HSP10)